MLGERRCVACKGALLSARGTEQRLFELASLTSEWVRDECFPREAPLKCVCGADMRGLDVPAVPGRTDERDAKARAWVWPGEVRVDVCTLCGRSFLEHGERALLEPLG